ncbi:MAG: PhoH family protein [Vulcanimicrobiaceae bacterium]
MLTEQSERIVDLASLGDPLRLCGDRDRNLSAVEQLLPVVLQVDGERLRVRGEARAVASAVEILARLRAAADGGAQLTPHDVALAAREVLGGAEERAHPKTILVTARGRELRPRTEGQRRYVEAIERNVLTFGIGPAGTGKTFLAVACAVRALRDKEVSRIVLTRPAVEAGEKLGFLPGDLREKVDPYLRPLYDALAECLDENAVAKLLERGTLEVAPLAYMRGRTLWDSYAILDEAQNVTREQLKMFLTRLGAGTKMIVCGDVTQIDLPRGVHSGLLDAPRLFEGVPSIALVEFGDEDVVRHPLVTEIIRAYARLASTNA